MTGVLLAKLDLGPVLEAVRRNGVAVVTEALAEPFRRQLERELTPVPYQVAPAEVGPVRQETDVLALRNLAGFPILAELASEFRTAVRAHAREIRGLQPEQSAAGQRHFSSDRGVQTTQNDYVQICPNA